ASVPGAGPLSVPFRRDSASAAKTANGAAFALRQGVYLTPIGYALFVRPLKGGGVVAPLAVVCFLGLRQGVSLTPLGYALFVSPLKWVVMLAPLALVFFLGFRAHTMRPATAQVTFWIYAALVGISLGVIFLIYTHTSIVRV